MIKRYLVKTALEETWPKGLNDAVLFLGEWCRIYSRKERWSKMNADILPYHWDDRNKLYNDYQYLNSLYEDTLNNTKEQLNRIHDVDYSLRYWRILIGPWLAYFMQMVFDRWAMLNFAFKSYNLDYCKILLTVDNTFIPNDFRDFDNMCIDDKWNEMIYGQLLEEYWKNHIDFEYITIKNDQVENTYRDNGLIRSSLSNLKQSFLSAINKYKYWMNSSDDYFFFKNVFTL